ncbi:MAG: hypothetical protein ABIT01_16305 [Thermoanaerobaculia bacterium]
MRSHPVENRAVTEAPDALAIPFEEESRARLAVRLEGLKFDLELAGRVRIRLEAELRRQEQQYANLEVERDSLRHRLDERQRYVAAIHASGAWKLVQGVRGLFGRRW